MSHERQRAGSALASPGYSPYPPGGDGWPARPFSTAVEAVVVLYRICAELRTSNARSTTPSSAD
jgi:hypothetical protein